MNFIIIFSIFTINGSSIIKFSFFYYEWHLICVFSKIITIAEDTIMNIYEAKSSKFLHKIDLENEHYAIASNNIDKIAIGGDNKQIDIHTIKDGDDSFTNGTLLNEPFLAMHFQSSI